MASWLIQLLCRRSPVRTQHGVQEVRMVWGLGGGGGGGVLPPRGSSRGGVVGVRGIIFSHPHPASPMDHSLEGLADLELKVCDLELDVCTGVAHQG